MEFSGWEKLSLVDYDDNITTTLFMAGCPFRCPFCHNGDLVLHPERAAIIPFDEILSYLRKRQGVLDAVCVSGGEPTLMNDLKEKLKAMKDLGYKIKLDSNGWRPEVLKELISLHLVDYVAMDIKNSLARYSETCGTLVDLEQIKASVSLLMESGIDYEFRTTLVDEFHDEKDILEIGKWIKGAKKYFLQRYMDNEHCIEKGLHAVSIEKAKQFEELLRPYVESVSLRGYDEDHDH